MNSRRPVLSPPLWELGSLGLLIAGYLLIPVVFDDPGVDLLNIVGPLWLMGTLGSSALRMARRDANAIWTALFWFRISVSVYFAGGSLVPILADELTREYLLIFSYSTVHDILKVNLIVAVACFTVLTATKLVLGAGGIANHSGKAHQPDSDGKTLLAVGLLFLSVGVTIKYLFVVPYMFGVATAILPGSIQFFGDLTWVAIYLLTVWSREHRRRALPLIAGFVLFEMLVGILATTKFATLMTLILFLLAFLRPKVTLPRLLAVAGTLIVSYIVITPLVEAGRVQLRERYGELAGAGFSVSGAGAGFSERVEVLGNSLGLVGDLVQRDGASAGWVRISYAIPASFAIQQYDSGKPGHSLSNALAVFIPRALWPEKPVITQVAIDFNIAATGNQYSSSAPGVFADAYWNYGWLGVILAMTPLGVLFALLSRFALDTLRKENWLYMPIVLLGMQIGFQIDGFIVSNVLGGAVLVLAGYVCLKILETLMFTRKRLPVPH